MLHNLTCTHRQSRKTTVWLKILASFNLILFHLSWTFHWHPAAFKIKQPRLDWIRLDRLHHITWDISWHEGCFHVFTSTVLVYFKWIGVKTLWFICGVKAKQSNYRILWKTLCDFSMKSKDKVLINTLCRLSCQESSLYKLEDTEERLDEKGRVEIRLWDVCEIRWDKTGLYERTWVELKQTGMKWDKTRLDETKWNMMRLDKLRWGLY